MTSQPILDPALSEAPYVFGVDVGGTGIKIGLLDNQGRTVAYRAIETEEPKGPAAAMQRVADTCREMVETAGLQFSDVSRIGLGTPGSQDIAAGKLIEPPNHPHWHYFPIVECLENAIGKPVSYINDANAAAFGEFWVGTASAHESLVMLTLGTGVGGGVIIDGHLVVGKNSFGAECGHMLIDPSPEARLCAWGGGRGQLEAYASANAIAERAEEAIASGQASSLKQHAGSITSKHVYEAAKEGDAYSIALIDSTASYLGLAISTLVHLLDPGIVVLGGAVDFGGKNCEIGQRFLTEIIRVFRERSFEHIANGTKIEFASLGADAGYIGAAGFARACINNSNK